MSTRQYIGARYVPKFANPIEWDSARSYEALEIVTYLGTSYTSKKNVPAGTAITNTTYWVATGNYNAQVAEYKAEVDALKEGVKGYVRNKCIFLTDSYGNYTDSDSKNFITVACEYAGISTSNYYLFNRGGTGFARGGELSFLDLLTDNARNVPDKADITDIFVFGGANDQVLVDGNPFTVAEIETAIGNFVSYCKTNYPNATVRIGFVTKSWEANYYPNAGTVAQAYSRCAKYGAVYLVNSENIVQQYSAFRTDRVHPAESFVDKLAAYVAQLILNNSCDVREFAETSLSINTNHTLYTTNGASIVAGTDHFRMWHNNGTVTASATSGLSLFAVSFDTPISLTNEYYFNSLFKLNDTFFLSDGNNCKGFTGNCMIYKSDNSTTAGWYSAFIPAVYVDGKPALNMFIYVPANVANVNKISFHACSSVVTF